MVDHKLLLNKIVRLQDQQLCLKLASISLDEWKAGYKDQKCCVRVS